MDQQVVYLREQNGQIATSDGRVLGVENILFCQHYMCGSIVLGYAAGTRPFVPDTYSKTSNESPLLRDKTINPDIQWFAYNIRTLTRVSLGEFNPTSKDWQWCWAPDGSFICALLRQPPHSVVHKIYTHTGTLQEIVMIKERVTMLRVLPDNRTLKILQDRTPAIIDLDHPNSVRYKSRMPFLWPNGAPNNWIDNRGNIVCMQAGNLYFLDAEYDAKIYSRALPPPPKSDSDIYVYFVQDSHLVWQKILYCYYLHTTDGKKELCIVKSIPDVVHWCRNGPHLLVWAGNPSSTYLITLSDVIQISKITNVSSHCDACMVVERPRLNLNEMVARENDEGGNPEDKREIKILLRRVPMDLNLLCMDSLPPYRE